MFCSKCGKEIDEGSAFCKYCGAKIDNSIQKEEKKEKNSIYFEAILTNLEFFYTIIRVSIFFVIYGIITMFMTKEIAFLLYGILGGGMLGAIISLIRNRRNFAHREMYIKNSSVFYISKGLRNVSFEIPVEKISSLASRQKILDKIFGTFIVSINSSSGNINEYGVKNGVEFVEMINKIR